MRQALELGVDLPGFGKHHFRYGQARGVNRRFDGVFAHGEHGPGALVDQDIERCRHTTAEKPRLTWRHSAQGFNAPLLS